MLRISLKYGLENRQSIYSERQQLQLPTELLAACVYRLHMPYAYSIPLPAEGTSGSPGCALFR